MESLDEREISESHKFYSYLKADKEDDDEVIYSLNIDLFCDCCVSKWFVGSWNWIHLMLYAAPLL